MTADPLTPAWIASRLTEPQRQALLWLPGDGGERDFPAEHDAALIEIDSLEIAENVIVLLAELLLSGWRATPLGLRVRAVVAGEAGVAQT